MGLLVKSAVLAALGFRGRVNTVGIDLGTTFSVVAVNEHGTVRVLPDLDGRNITPSVVGFVARDPNREAGEDKLKLPWGLQRDAANEDEGIVVGRAAVAPVEEAVRREDADVPEGERERAMLGVSSLR